MTRFLVLIFAALSMFIACSHTDDDKERFIRTYKEILVSRERFQDTTVANAEVKKAYKKNQYTEQTFFEDWKYYTQDPKEFLIMMDTIRSRAQKELIKLEKEK
ncbi:MAG: hypothetical protein L0Y76_13045 [Ignavibacteria bacterium]|nr:hypothetical protein [Ignavibacteria bacterium]